MSQKAARGTKRTCLGCGARFYDLENTPVVCPMCEAEFKLSPAETKDEEPEVVEAEKPVAAVAVPTDAPDGDTDDTDETDEADELADIETDDAAVAEDDNTFIEDDDDPNASVAAIVPAKSGGEES